MLLMEFINKHCSLFIWKLLSILMIFLNLLVIFPHESLPPNGNLFHLIILFIGAHFLGLLSERIGLPPLFGMLVAGFLYGNFNDRVELDTKLSSTIRSLALIIILLRAGLNLDPKAIRRLSIILARLSLIPSIIESLIIGLLTWICFSFNLSWSLIIGFVIGSVSPAVVVPSMVDVQEKNYGTKRGIPTLLIASTSVDNVFAITAISVCLSFAFPNSNEERESDHLVQTVLTISRGPLEAITGIIYGIIIGIILWYIPAHHDSRLIKNSSSRTANHKNKKNHYEIHRFVLLATTSLFIWFGSQKGNFKSMGPIAILTAPFIASIRWRENNLGKFSRESLRILWLIFENFLFSLIGFNVRLRQLDISILLSGILIIVFSVIVRMIVAFAVTFGGQFDRNERLFMAIAWLPKATIQAAMAPIAMDLAQNTEDKRRAQIVLTLAALSILLTAPIGAILMNLTYKKLLQNDSNDIILNDTQALSPNSQQQRQTDLENQQQQQQSSTNSSSNNNNKVNIPLLLNDKPIQSYNT